MQVHRQVRIDEDEVPVVERARDAVSRVGGDEHAGEGRDRLARDQRMAHAQPGYGGPLLDETAAHEQDLHSGVVAHVVAGGEEGGRLALVGAWRRRRERRLVEGHFGETHAHCLRTQDLLAAGGEHTPDELDAAAGAQHPRRERERRERDGLEHLERRAHHHGAVASLGPLHRGSEQRRGRPAVLRLGAPGTARQFGGDVEIAVAVEEGVGHGGMMPLPGHRCSIAARLFLKRAILIARKMRRRVQPTVPRESLRRRW